MKEKKAYVRNCGDPGKPWGLGRAAVPFRVLRVLGLFLTRVLA